MVLCPHIAMGLPFQLEELTYFEINMLIITLHIFMFLVKFYLKQIIPSMIILLIIVLS